MNKTIIAVGEILTNCFMGIYTQYIWYSDGSFEELQIPKGMAIIPKDDFIE